MTLTRGAFGRFEHDRMVVLFSMMNGKVEIPCAISTDALDSLEKSGHVKPDQRAAQFERYLKSASGRAFTKGHL